MNDKTHMGLLPTGLADILPPEAEFEAHITEVLMNYFAQYGYDRVKPPLIEFEDILLSGSGKNMAKQTSRSLKQAVMGFKATDLLLLKK